MDWFQEQSTWGAGLSRKDAGLDGQLWDVAIIRGQPETSSPDEMTSDDALFELEISANPLSFTPPQGSSVDGANPAPTEADRIPRQSFRAFSSLSFAEEMELRAIAMPEGGSSLLTPPEHASSSSPVSSSATLMTRKCKRKDAIVGYKTPCTTEAHQSKRRGHNAIEKRYRTNLNDKILLLQQSIPSLRSTPDSALDSDDEEVSCDPRRLSKAVILTKAIGYITNLESINSRLRHEASITSTRVDAFEKLALSGALEMSTYSHHRAPSPECFQSL